MKAVFAHSFLFGHSLSSLLISWPQKLCHFFFVIFFLLCRRVLELFVWATKI